MERGFRDVNFDLCYNICAPNSHVQSVRSAVCSLCEVSQRDKLSYKVHLLFTRRTVLITSVRTLFYLKYLVLVSVLCYYHCVRVTINIHHVNWLLLPLRMHDKVLYTKRLREITHTIITHKITHVCDTSAICYHTTSARDHTHNQNL